MTAVILIGASGSGKTTIAQAISERAGGGIEVLFFDRVGVPSIEGMVRDYGSGEGWQHAKTIEWMNKLSHIARNKRPILFEGQTRLSFLAEGSMAAGWFDYVPLLVDCDDATRAKRLIIDRQQPELACADMMNWAAYLRLEAKAKECEILDTSAMTLDEAVTYVMGRCLMPICRM